jgi:hypothetical protein
MLNAIREKAPETAERVARQVQGEMETIARSVGAGMEKQIRSVRDQVEAILETRRSGGPASSRRS